MTAPERVDLAAVRRTTEQMKLMAQTFEWMAGTFQLAVCGRLPNLPYWREKLLHERKDERTVTYG